MRDTKRIVTERGAFFLTKVSGKFKPLTYRMSLKDAINFADNTRSFVPVIKKKLYNERTFLCVVGEIDPKGDPLSKNESLWALCNNAENLT